MTWGFFTARDYTGAARRLKAWISGTGETAEYTPAVKADLQVGGVDAGASNPVPVGGNLIRSAPASLPATSTTAYASGDVLGTKMRLADALRVASGSGLIQDITLTLKSIQTTQIDIFLFRADPSASTFTDNAAFTVAPADFDKVIGMLSMTKVNALGSNGCIYELNQLARSIKLDAGRDIWAVLVWRGAATLASTSDIAAFAANIAVD